MLNPVLPILFATAAAQPAFAPRTPAGCIDLRDPTREIALEGRLTRETFPGPPNYESVRHGDAAEHAYILELPREICIDDGGQFTDPAERIRYVQLYSTRRAVRARLSAARGQRIRIRGEGFGAQTGHHHASLVVDVREIREDGR